MSNDTMISPADLYAQIKDAFVADPSIEAALLKDLSGTISKRFNVDLPSAGRLVRNGAGFKLTYAGQDYDIGDPRNSKPGDLNDAELELVSGGAEDNCAPAPSNAGRAKSL